MSSLQDRSVLMRFTAGLPGQSRKDKGVTAQARIAHFDRNRHFYLDDPKRLAVLEARYQQDCALVLAYVLAR